MRSRAIQGLLGLLLLGTGVAFVDWRVGVAAFGLLLWVDSWRVAR